jgi:hypothetical protein
VKKNFSHGVRVNGHIERGFEGVTRLLSTWRLIRMDVGFGPAVVVSMARCGIRVGLIRLIGFLPLSSSTST